MDESWYDWIESKIEDLENDLKWTFDYLFKYTSNVYKASTDYSKLLFNTLNDKVNSYNNNNTRNIVELFNMLKSKADKATTATKDGLNNLANWTYAQLNKLNTAMVNNYNNSVNYARTLANDLLRRLNNAVGGVYDYLGRLIPGDFKDLLQYVRIAKCIIEQLRRSPVDFFISILLLFFIDWIQYQIAYQFGTKNATLPTEPNWYKRICQ